MSLGDLLSSLHSTAGEHQSYVMINVQGLSFSRFNIKAAFSLIFNLYHTVIREKWVLWKNYVGATSTAKLLIIFQLNTENASSL